MPSAAERTERRSAADLSVFLFRNLEKLEATLECLLNPLLGATLGCKSNPGKKIMLPSRGRVELFHAPLLTRFDCSSAENQEAN